MTHRRPGLVAICLLALLAARCNNNGTETDNPGGPEVAFQGSQCAHEGTSHDSAPPPSNGTHAPGAIGTSTARLEIAGDYTRLECMAWHRDGGELHVSIRNFRAACGIEWAGAAVTVDGSDVQLEPHNPRCLVARCGNCFYDLEFDVERAPESGDLHVSARVTDVDGKVCNDGVDHSPLRIPADDEGGVRCVPLDLGAFIPPPDECLRYAACSAACTCASGTRCAGPGSGSTPTVCIPECEDSADCPVQGAFECVEGLCKTLPWE